MDDPLNLGLSELPTPIGTLLLVTDAAGCLRALDFLEYGDRLRHRLALHYGSAGFALRPGAPPRAIADALASYFSGRDCTAIDRIPVETGGTPFQRSVWSALRTIACGTTVTYGELARHIGRPRAFRAVGLANNANPVGIVVPCHRVVGADGSLTGYGGGLDRKRWLLAHEARPESAVPGAS